ncbi:hypothetical protein KP509_13G045600 [Ceratopteris richardii]|uniref:Reverse transcriptase domain-containing protein n=1 Tax=Ceratopteris richardii TaxID=49495 RepID=A0A8T2TD83_CERRI|nr:hypothetical protein KP509_13G045600 [Ceratopteris richardii]
MSSQESASWNEILSMLNCKDLWGHIGGHTLRYTFHSRSHRKAMSRLDRCYYSHVHALKATSKMWIDATVLLSDHNPLLVSLEEVDWNSCIPRNLSRIPLRVNHLWMHTYLFKSKVQDLIHHVLSLKVSACMKWEYFIEKLQDVIRDCGKFFSKVLHSAKCEAQQLICNMTEKVDAGIMLSDNEYIHLCKAYKCLELIENQAMQSSKVKARCTEVNDLHANSKYFFDFLRAKRSKDMISPLHLLHLDGSVINDGSSIEATCSEHFKKLFGASYKSDEPWFDALHESLMYTPQNVDSHMAAPCEKKCTEEEINGRLSEPFPIERPERQGCPLSPLFYALASSPMFYLLEAKMNLQMHSWFGFADDTIIFAKAEEQNIRNILDSLAPFSEASALNINMKKSAIINIYAPHFQSLEWEGPKIERGSIFRHLGYPLGVGVPIKHKTDWWFPSQWPLHIRIRIVQTFMQPYILYYLLLMDGKKNHLRTFDSLVKNFLWNKKHTRAMVLSSWEYVCQPRDRGGLGILNLHTHLMARRVAFFMRITSSHKPLWVPIFWKLVENAECYNSKWEILSFPEVRRLYAVGATYISKWLQVVSLLQKYQMPLSLDASDPWRDWLFAKHNGWWVGKSNMYYRNLIAPISMAQHCNQRWKLQKSVSWWCLRFLSIWDSSYTFKMKLFMWRVFVGHFTLGAFLNKHGLPGIRCPHCTSYMENMRHAFWSCAFIQKWWNHLLLFPISDVKPTKFDCTFLLLHSNNNAKDWIRKRCVLLLLRNIWMFRNFKTFRNKGPAPAFSWQYCKTVLWLDVQVMPSADRGCVASLLNEICQIGYVRCIFMIS